MQPRTLLVMLGVVLVLGGFIYFFEKDLPSTEERRDLDKKVLRVEEDDVEAVVIEWDDHEVRLEKDAAKDGDEGSATREWRLVEPLRARADRTAVTGLLSSLTGLEKKRTLEDVDRGAVGLDEPEIEVTLVTADGGEVKLDVGPEVPASSDRIVAAGEVYQVAGSFVTSLTKEPGEWRDKQLFTATRLDVDRVTLAAGDSKVLLARRGEDFWIESPLTDRADGRLTDDLLTDVTGLRVATFLDEAPLDPEVIGLDPPRRVVEVVLKDEEEPFRLELGAPVGVEGAEDESAGDVRTYGRAEGQLFEIESSLGEAFGRPPQAWRSREWTAVEVFKIESASIHGGDGDLEMTRDKADWKRGEDRIDYSTASDLLYALTDAAAEEVVDRSDAESRGHRFDEPALSIRLTTKEGEDQLRLYPEVDGFAAATSEGREAVLLLSAETVSGIHEKIDAVRTAAPLAEEEDEEDGGDDEGEPK